MHLSTLEAWLDYIASIHRVEMDLGLDRVKKVAEKLGVMAFTIPIITVAGTNGKGSTVAGLEAIYRAAGYSVGVFTSPILFKHNELVRINRLEPSDEMFCEAYEKIEHARDGITLTPFEFNTLAALLIFKSQPLDVLILEVGLGGRLDAVNILDADVAIVTSIGIDHTEWLGNTREEIAREKVGIFRPHRPAICGDVNPPNTLIEAANAIDAVFLCQEKDFHFKETYKDWTWEYQQTRYEKLPWPTLAIQNMSTVLMAITSLQKKLPIQKEHIDKGLLNVTLPGRIQIISGPVSKIFDVSHNPAAVQFLADHLKEITCYGKTHAVFSMLADKDIPESIKAIRDLVDHWYVAPLANKRAASMEMLKTAFEKAEVKNTTFFASIEEAYNFALLKAELGDRLVVFGSFHTVADVRRAMVV